MFLHIKTYSYEDFNQGLSIAVDAVPLVFSETDFSGLGSKWRIPLDGGKLRFDVSTTGFFATYNNPLTLSPDGKIGINTDSPQRSFHIQPNSGGDVYFRLSTDSATNGTEAALDFHMTSNQAGQWGARISAERIGINGRSDLKFLTTNDSGTLLERMRITKDGNVGIDTSSPAAELHIGTGGSPLKNYTYGSDGLMINSYYLNTTPSHRMVDIVSNGGQYNESNIRFFTKKHGKNPLEQLRITGVGNVGIGITSPSNKLEVNGTIRAKEVIVETVNWPDYVFEDSYVLPSLSEVSQHIEEYGHLPGTERADAVTQSGQTLGETQRLMMQKIEELTLYLIDKDTEIQKLKKQLNFISNK